MGATSRPTLSLSRPWLPGRKAPLASSGTRGPLGNDLRPLDLFSFGCSNLYNHTKAQLLNSSGLLVQQGIKAQIRSLLFWGESCGGWLVKSLFCLNSCGYLAGFLVIFLAVCLRVYCRLCVFFLVGFGIPACPSTGWCQSLQLWMPELALLCELLAWLCAAFHRTAWA